MGSAGMAWLPSPVPDNASHRKEKQTTDGKRTDEADNLDFNNAIRPSRRIGRRNLGNDRSRQPQPEDFFYVTKP